MATVTPLGALGAHVAGIDVSQPLYRPDEWRLRRRCQIKADWIFTDSALAVAMA